MGAQQTWEWAVRFPTRWFVPPDRGHRAEHAARLPLHRTLLDAITSDPASTVGVCRATDVIAGLHRHADIWATHGADDGLWKTEFWRGIPPLVEECSSRTYDDFRTASYGCSSG